MKKDEGACPSPPGVSVGDLHACAIYSSRLDVSLRIPAFFAFLYLPVEDAIDRRKFETWPRYSSTISGSLLGPGKRRPAMKGSSMLTCLLILATSTLRTMTLGKERAGCVMRAYGWSSPLAYNLARWILTYFELSHQSCRILREFASFLLRCWQVGALVVQCLALAVSFVAPARSWVSSASLGVPPPPCPKQETWID